MSTLGTHRCERFLSQRCAREIFERHLERAGARVDIDLAEELQPGRRGTFALPSAFYNYSGSPRLCVGAAALRALKMPVNCIN